MKRAELNQLGEAKLKELTLLCLEALLPDWELYVSDLNKIEFFDGVITFIKLPADTLQKSTQLFRTEKLTESELRYVNATALDLSSVDGAMYWDEIRLSKFEKKFIVSIYHLHHYLVSPDLNSLATTCIYLYNVHLESPNFGNSPALNDFAEAHLKGREELAPE